MFSWLASLFDSWPKGIPKLYPRAKDADFYEFMSKREFDNISRFPVVRVYPPCATQDDEETAAFAFALSRLLIRNLMLLPDLSVQGPEDTPLIPFDVLLGYDALIKENCFSLTGRSDFRNGFVAEFKIISPSGELSECSVKSYDLDSFILDCCGKVAEKLGSRIGIRAKDRWKHGQPKNLDSMLRYGNILLQKESEGPYENSPSLDRTVSELFESDSRFVLPIHQISGDSTDKRRMFLKGMESDPFDAQLCFLIFCEIWESKGVQASAFQFVRRAIELSPGHGKAHMCAPHTAPASRKMLRHSELGYRLLPGNSFAVSNYINYLEAMGGETDALIRLALEGIQNDPYDPSNYHRIIELNASAKNYPKALEYALRLQDLLDPPVHERTLYCLKQNPIRKAMLEAGTYDPAQENRELIKKLRQLSKF